MASSAGVGKVSLSSRLANGLGLIWGLADKAADTWFRYVGCFGLIRGPLLFTAVEDFSVEKWRGENVLVARA